jgi:hypothetical protein
MKRPARPDNFSYLPPDAPKTRRLIEAMLSAKNRLPYEPGPNDPRPERAPLAELADRIARRAMQGRNVTLKPETARTVATSLLLVADGDAGRPEVHAHRAGLDR